MKSYIVTTKMVVKDQIRAESGVEAMDLIYMEFGEVFNENSESIEQSAEEVKEVD